MPIKLRRMLKMSKGNYLAVEQIIAVLDGRSPLGKRLYDEAKMLGKLAITTKKKRAAIFLTESGWVFVSDLQSDDMAGVVDRMLEDLQDD